MTIKRSLAGGLVLTFALGAFAMPAAARTQDERIADLERLLAQQAQRIAELEAKVERQGSQSADGRGLDTAQPAPAAPATQNSAPPALATAGPDIRQEIGVPGLDLFGDMRLRYEHNWSQRGQRDRGRGVLRARLGATYRFDDMFSAGARIVTGNPDDPNTADVTLSNFDDDLDVALDQAYVTANLGPGQLTLGKMPQVFRKTDLVWDDDVNPQGLSLKASLPLGHASRLELRGLYFLIDEAVLGADSSMRGGQAAFVASPSHGLELSLAAAYYDYRIRSVAGADAGDFRDNRRRADGGYLSDFNLLDILGTARWQGLGDRWPLSVTADYVMNKGSAGGTEDRGLALISSLGRTTERGDWQVGYSYLQADADAVLAAFSHDNVDLATDYLLHALTIDYVLRRHAVLNLTLYHYRAQHSALPEGIAPDWRNRLRLNFSYSF